MWFMKKRRDVLLLLLMILCTNSLAIYAGEGALDIRVEGKEVLAEVYQVGTINEEGNIIFDEEYGIVSTLSNAQDIKRVINNFDENMKEKPDISKLSNDDGIIQIVGLEKGVYYVRFSGGEYERTYASTLIQIEDNYQEIHPKHEELVRNESNEIVRTGDDNLGDMYLIMSALSILIIFGTRKINRK